MFESLKKYILILINKKRDYKFISRLTSLKTSAGIIGPISFSTNNSAYKYPALPYNSSKGAAKPTFCGNKINLQY